MQDSMYHITLNWNFIGDRNFPAILKRDIIKNETESGPSLHTCTLNIKSTG